MQIENDIAHCFLFVESEFEGHKEGFYSKPLSNPARGLEYFWVIDEPWRPNEHVCELLHYSIGRVMLHLKEGGLHADLGVVGMLLGNTGFLEGHIHSNL